MDPVSDEIEMLKRRLNQIEIELCAALSNVKRDTEKISELYENVKRMNEDMRLKEDSK